MPDNASIMNEVQRTLGRMEAAQSQILALVKDLQERMGDHVQSDQIAFSEMRVAIADQKAELTKQFQSQSDDRMMRLDAQDARLEKITSYIDWAKGASWPILALMSLIGLVLVGILIELLVYWFKIGKT